MNTHDFSDFQRYLAAKVSVDDRSLNKDVWNSLFRALHPWRERPLRVLDVGAGIGTMAQRLWRWRLHPHILYTGVDLSSENIDHAQAQLQEWARGRGGSVLRTANGFVLRTSTQQMTISLIQEDALSFVRRPEQQGAWDLLIAHAFLDLVDIAAVLPQLLATLKQGGFCYLTLNFDGVTIFEPVAEPSFETKLIALYHQSMDQRLIEGRLSGDSRAGRHLFAHLNAAGVDVMAAGASDWVVIPQKDGYPEDEAYFLHFIVHTVFQELVDHPQLDRDQVVAWTQERHAQIDAGTLVYIAHQLDYLGRK